MAKKREQNDWARWLDYARGVGSEASRARMAKELESADAATRAFVARMQAAARIAGEDEPNQDAIARAKNVFPARPTETRPSASLGDVIARLVFDSFTAPLAAGVRSGTASRRQLVFEASPVEIILSFEQSRGETAVVGQLAQTEPEAKPLAGLTVNVRRGDTVLLTTQTNEFGEFHARFAGLEQVSLEISAPALGRRIRVPLDEHDLSAQ